MTATAGLWSSVCSVGAVNPPDIEKVVLVGSVVQLGATGGVIAASRQAAARTAVAVAGPATQALIRYGVTAVGGASSADLEALLVSFAILCRPGSGQIAARLVQVPNSSPAVYVAETTLVEFQAQKTAPIDPNLFTLQTVSGSDAAVFDFESNAYYVEVVLTAPDVVTEYPPAVSLIQLSFTIPPGGGSGGGGGSHHQPD